MSSNQFLSVCGLRADGRRPGEVRLVRARVGVAPNADGSASVDIGGTRVLALVHGPRHASSVRRGVGNHDGGEDAASITVEYIVAPFAGAADRNVKRSNDRAVADAAAALCSVFESVVLARLYPRSEIAITIHVLATDGGALAAAVNAGALALADAGVAMRDLVSAAGALHTPSGPLCDPCGAELSAGAPELTLAILPSTGDALLANLDSRLPQEALKSLMLAASAGARQAYEVISATLREATARKGVEREGGEGEGEGGGYIDEGEGEEMSGEGVDMGGRRQATMEEADVLVGK